MRARDRNSDGQFFYAVGTTGVFCRPSCGARPAKPENMAFYETAADAETAGFRPCRRCKPAQSSESDALVARMRLVATHIAERADEPLTLERLAAVAGMSPSHLQRTFKFVLGVSPKEFHSAKRLEGFKSRLRTGESVLGAVFDEAPMRARVTNRPPDPHFPSDEKVASQSSQRDIHHGAPFGAAGPAIERRG